MSARAEWDFFLIHAAADARFAKRLQDALKTQARVFLDVSDVTLGDVWPAAIPAALRASLISVPIVTTNLAAAYYARSEIAEAIGMMRVGRHRVIPIFVGVRPEDAPYGLNVLQGPLLGEADDLRDVADELIAGLRRLRHLLWQEYGGLFELSGYRIAYIPLLGGGGDKLMLSWNNIAVHREMRYRLPAVFANTVIPDYYEDRPSCRLSSYNVSPGKLPLHLTFAETSYGDYLKSGEHLDDPLPGDATRTFRDAFGQLIEDGHTNMRRFDLTNICGVGLFIVSSDDYVVISRHSNQSHVYPGRLTFAASGVMRWGAYPDPFSEVMRKAFEELHHQVNLHELNLFGVGVDARKLYFQFGFLEKAGVPITDILEVRPTTAECEGVPFELGPIVEKLLSDCWEPAAEAALLTLCIQRFGREAVSAELAEHSTEWDRRSMREEWDYRASRPDPLPDMSPRYPADEIAKESRKYTGAVFRFIGSDVNDATVLEVGPGTGRITERLVRHARSVVCVDLSQRMIERNRRRLGDDAGRVDFRCMFAQDFRARKRFDIAICSLVLIHNVADAHFEDLVNTLTDAAEVVFVFEDVTRDRPTSPHTRLRPLTEIISAFRGRNFHPQRQRLYSLFSDDLAFVKFVRGRRRIQSA